MDKNIQNDKENREKHKRGFHRLEESNYRHTQKKKKKNHKEKHKEIIP